MEYQLQEAPLFLSTRHVFAVCLKRREFLDLCDAVRAVVEEEPCTSMM